MNRRHFVTIVVWTAVVSTVWFLYQWATEYPQISVKAKGIDAASMEAVQRLRADPYADGKVKMSFYGQVIDENSKPVPGARVKFQWTDNSSQGTSEAETVSDSNGCFKLTGRHGKNLGVDVLKEGYYISKRNRRPFEFAQPDKDYYEPDPDHPYIFYLRKKGRLAATIKVDKYFDVPSNGDAFKLDLLSGMESDAGQLTVQTWKPPAVGIYFPYDWRIHVALEGGGFTEWKVENDEYGFEAPADGYVPVLDYQLHATGGMSGNSMSANLFFTIGQPPQYGRITIHMHGQGENTHIKYVLNPTPYDRDLESGYNLSGK